jgi:hypothetical protein
MGMNPNTGNGGGTPSCPAGTSLNRSNELDSTGHFHTLSIPCDDVNIQAGLRTYTVSLVGGHDHDVTLDSIDFGTLLGGAVVTKGSTTTNNHAHVYSISLQ